MSKICGIYQIINTETDETYVGHSTNIQKRWSNHKRYLDLGEHSYETLNDGWIKDIVRFELLEECDEEELQEREDYYINYLGLVGFTVINRNKAGKSFRNSPKGRQAKSNSQKGKLNGNCRLSEQDVLRIREMYSYEEGYTMIKLAEMFNVSHSHVSAILKGRRWGTLK